MSTETMTNVPVHVSMIMDGNGRWAKERHLPRSAGHKAGADTFEKIVKYCDKIGVKAITAYAFSTENWNRPQAEVDNLMELLYNYLQMAEEKFAGTNIILRVIGDRSALSDKINRAIDHAIEITNGNTGIILNMALNYGGQDEIVRASRIAAEAVLKGEITPDEITKEYLDEHIEQKKNHIHKCPLKKHCNKDLLFGIFINLRHKFICKSGNQTENNK